MTALTLASGARGKGAARTDDKAKTGKVRVQFDLHPRSMDRLTALKEKTQAASYAEVVKNALRLYEALIAETEEGRDFLTRDRNGVTAPFRMFL